MCRRAFLGIVHDLRRRSTRGSTFVVDIPARGGCGMRAGEESLGHSVSLSETRCRTGLGDTRLSMC